MKQQEPKPRDPELIAIGERARLAREAQGLSREKLAEAADTSPQFLAQMEKGEQSMTTLKLKRLATALHVSSDYLLYGQPPFTGSAELAVELLAQKIRKEPTPSMTYVVPGRLVVRDSTGAPPM